VILHFGLTPDHEDALWALLSWSLACFFLGVGYSCWKAVGWAERMRAWAAVSCEQETALAATAGAATSVPTEQLTEGAQL
jgi:hypothetical protein